MASTSDMETLSPLRAAFTDLAPELSELSEQQCRALQETSNRSMTYREETEYDRRRERISEICRLLSQIPTAYLQDARQLRHFN